MQALIAISASGIVVNIGLALALYRKINIVVYQHGLLWRDFEKRKQLNGTGEA